MKASPCFPFKLLWAGLAVLLLSISELSAQDGHYWTEFYGTRSTILNGVVIGSVEDLAAIYYNPARLGIQDNTGVILSGKVYEWTSLTIKNALADGVNLTESSFGGAPSLAAGTFRFRFLPKHQFGYAFLTRYRLSNDFFVREEREGEFIDGFPGPELFDGSLTWSAELKEEWFGLSWSYPVSERIRVGFTGFYSDRSKKAKADLRLTAVGQTGKVAQLIRNRELGYKNSGLLGKFGIAAELPPVSLGLTVTTPRWNLFGSGNLVYEDILNGLGGDQGGIDGDGFVANSQRGLPAEHRWPWSIGAGAGWSRGKNMIHMSAEWFSRIPRYTIMEANDFVGQTTGDTISQKITEDLNSVLNFGVGYEYFFNDRYSAHASVATDYSGVKSDVNRFSDLSPETSNSSFQKDFFHYGGGVSLKFTAVEFTLGGTYTTAEQTIERPIDFPEGDDGPIFGSEATATARTHRWRFLFGFELFFLDDLKNRSAGK